MIVGINKRRFLFFIFFILTVIGISLAYKPVTKSSLYPKKYSRFVESAAKKYDIDENLIYAIIKAESGFNEKATSRAGAKGLMQITDSTAKWIGGQIDIDENADIFDPQINITLGTWYIAKLLKDNDGNLIMALASYNAGSGNVKDWQQQAGKDNILPEDMPFEETENYVNKTLKYYESYKKLYD